MLSEYTILFFILFITVVNMCLSLSIYAIIDKKETKRKRRINSYEFDGFIYRE